MTARARSRESRPRVILRLYVAGDSPNSAMAKTNLQAAIAHMPSGQVSLEIVDVFRDPERGLRDRVLVTPTLVRVAPPPEVRVIGNLRDRQTLLSGLGLVEGVDP